MSGILLSVALALACGADPQTPPAEPGREAPEPGVGGERGRPPWPGVALLSMSAAFETRVTGAPFSATIDVRFEQRLADGNRIVRASSGRLARDAEGRVRREQELAAIGPWMMTTMTTAATGMTEDAVPRMIVISDPTEGVVHLLIPERRLARRLPAPRGAPPAEGGPGPREPGGGGGVRESLGQRTVEGVAAEGTRTVHTIPAGALGNERPIEVVSERWYSPELKTVVQSLHSDPRLGETRFRLAGIERGDPDPALFQVPPDYQVVDARERPDRRSGRRPTLRRAHERVR